MKYLLPLFAAALLFSGCSTISERMRYLASPPKDSLRAFRVDLAAYEKKYPKDDGVILSEDNAIEHYGIMGSSGRWTCRRSRSHRYLVLDPDAEWLTTFELDCDPYTTLEFAYVDIIAPDGEIRSYTHKDFERIGDPNGGATYKFAYPKISKGTIIQMTTEMRVGTHTASSIRHDVALQYSIPCEKLSFSWYAPDWWSLQVKQIGNGVKPKHTTLRDPEKRKQILRYEATDIPAFPDEPYSPYFKEAGAYLECQATSYSMYGMERSPRSWSDLGMEFRDYAIDKGSFWSGRLVNTVRDLTGTCTSDVQKLDTIIDYVRTRVHIGNSEESDNFADVLEKGEANPYMINGLVLAMLEEAGIKAEYLLVHSAYDGYFDDNYISPDQLYIPGIAATINGRQRFLFPLYGKFPTDLIPEFLQGEPALKITDEGSGGFTTIPYNDSLSPDRVNDVYALSIDEEGTVTVREERTLTGASAYWMRVRIAEMNEEELKTEMKSLLTYSDGDITIESHEVVNRANYKEPLIIRITYKISDLISLTPDEAIFQTGGLFSPVTNTKWKIDTEERQTPIRIYSNEELTKEITITHPESWTLTTPLKDVKLENVFGSIEGTYATAPGKVSIRHHRVVRRANQPKEKADDLLDVTGRRSKLNVPTLIFSLAK